MNDKWIVAGVWVGCLLFFSLSQISFIHFIKQMKLMKRLAGREREERRANQQSKQPHNKAIPSNAAWLWASVWLDLRCGMGWLCSALHASFSNCSILSQFVHSAYAWGPIARQQAKQTISPIRKSEMRLLLLCWMGWGCPHSLTNKFTNLSYL